MRRGRVDVPQDANRYQLADGSYARLDQATRFRASSVLRMHGINAQADGTSLRA
jgi:cell division protein FtsN